MSRDAYVAVETGGTKIVCRIIDDETGTLAEQNWPTTTSDDAAEAIASFVAATLPAGARVAGVGLAAFGPLIVDPVSPKCGLMLQTTKEGWSGSNLRAALAARLAAPVAVDTDVNAAAIAEHLVGAGRGLPSVAYVTVGTGIGGGLAFDGRSLTNALHPEIGHVPLVRIAGDTVPSMCPFHDNCAEGLAAGPAVGRRLAGRSLAEAPDIAATVAEYIGQLLGVLVLAWSPHRIVLGGGVMSTPGLIRSVDAALRLGMGSYGADVVFAAQDYVVPASFAHAGLEGAMLLARAVAVPTLALSPRNG